MSAPDPSRFSYPRAMLSVAARRGVAFEIRQGECFQILDQSGQQTCPLIACRQDDRAEWASPAHTREGLGSVMLRPAGEIVSARRTPMLRLEEDTVGRHDLTMPLCDGRRYRDRYDLVDHPNCRDNLATALGEFDVAGDHLPDPINLFMHVAILGRGELEVRAPLSAAGDYVVFRALTDLIVAVSACPQDQNAQNGAGPTDLIVRIFSE